MFVREFLDKSVGYLMRILKFEEVTVIFRFFAIICMLWSSCRYTYSSAIRNRKTDGEQQQN
jgi:hypothetical protein